MGDGEKSCHDDMEIVVTIVVPLVTGSHSRRDGQKLFCTMESMKHAAADGEV